MYGAEGFCLVWAINNAFKRKILDKDMIVAQIKQMDRNNPKRTLKYYIGKDGIDFRSFKKLLKTSYGIKLTKVSKYTNKGKYLLTYDFGSYLHTVAMTNGEVIDSRKEKEITTPTPNVPLVDVYKITAA
jgi:hypothetical protein